MRLLSALRCPKCGRGDLNLAQVNVRDGLPSGQFDCPACGFVGHFDDGVLDILPLRSVSSAMVKRNQEAYSDFWQRGKAAQVQDEVTHEDVLFQQWSRFLTGESLLDAGCGNGRQMHHFLGLQYREFIGVDVSDAIYQARDRFRQLRRPGQTAFFLRAELDRLPLADRVVDDVWSSGTLGLLPDQGAALDELARLALRRLNIAVLTEKTLTGRLYLAANWIKPVVNRVNNYRLLYGLAGVAAWAAWLLLKLIYMTGFETRFLRRDTLKKALSHPQSRARIQWGLYDPLIIPRVIKHPDHFYHQRARAQGFILEHQVTEIICDYYFLRTKLVG